MIRISNKFPEPDQDLLNTFCLVYAENKDNLGKAIDACMVDGSKQLMTINIIMHVFKVHLGEAHLMFQSKESCLSGLRRLGSWHTKEIEIVVLSATNQG